MKGVFAVHKIFSKEKSFVSFIRLFKKPPCPSFGLSWFPPVFCFMDDMYIQNFDQQRDPLFKKCKIKNNYDIFHAEFNYDNLRDSLDQIQEHFVGLEKFTQLFQLSKSFSMISTRQKAQPKVSVFYKFKLGFGLKIDGLQVEELN